MPFVFPQVGKMFVVVITFHPKKNTWNAPFVETFTPVGISKNYFLWQEKCIARDVKFLNIYLIFFYLPSSVVAQPFANWLVQQKISLSTYGYCVSIGRNGNIYVSGGFVGSYRGSSSSSRGCFLTCYNDSGERLWSKEYYSSEGVAAKNIVTETGEVILAGIGLKKFSPEGNLISEFGEESTSYVRVKYDPLDNTIVIVGTNPDKVFGGVQLKDISFISRLTTQFNVIDTKDFFFDYTSIYQGFDICLDNFGNIYSTGDFGGTASICSSISITSSGSYDGYLVKYDRHLNPIWAKSFGGQKSESPSSIAVNNNGEIYIVGTFYGIMNVEGKKTAVQKGVCDLFIIKYDQNGTPMWLRSAGGKNLDKVQAIATDTVGNVFITGCYDSPGTFQLDASPVTNIEKDKGGLYLLELDPNGNAISFLSAGGAVGFGRDVKWDEAGNLYHTGSFGGKLDFAGKTIEGDDEMFLMKLSYDISDKVGIKEESVPNTFKIFPNPATDSFTLIVNDDLCPYTSLSIYDISGRRIFLQEYLDDCAPKIKCIATPGIYLVEILSENKRVTSKVVIQ